MLSFPLCIKIRYLTELVASWNLTIILNSFVYSFACLLVCLFVCLFFVRSFGNYSQSLHKGLKVSGFDGGHPRNVIKKFGEDRFVR